MITIQGTLTDDPILEATQSQRNICLFTLEVQEEGKTSLMRFVAFDEVAIRIYRGFVKGQVLSVSGHKQNSGEIFVTEAQLIE